MKIRKNEVNISFINQWSSKGIHPAVLSILYRRNIKDNLHLFRFLCLSPGMLPSPFLFPHLDVAYQRLTKAITEKEKIVLFGDRDVDGVTSVHIMSDFLKELGADFQWRVPVGEEPYGLSMKGVAEFSDICSLLITVDCGITNSNEIQFLKEKGIDTIVIDHHQPTEVVPPALVIINPKYQYSSDETDMAACVVSYFFVIGYYFYRSVFYHRIDKVHFAGENYYFTNLKILEEIPDHFDEEMEIEQIQGASCFKPEDGTEIAMEMACEAYRNLLFSRIDGIKTAMEKYLPYAALGTISDIMPLNCVTNRLIVSLGLKLMRRNPDERIDFILQKYKIDRELTTANDIAWKISPLLNSPGRMGDARIAVNYLDEQYHEKREENLEKLLEMNENRKKLGEEAFRKFVGQIEENLAEYAKNLNFFYSSDICRGVLGITATKISERSGKPAIVAVVDEEYAVGSMRGNTDLHLVEFLSKASSLFEEYGGHHFAAGFRLKVSLLEEFKCFLRTHSHQLMARDGSKGVDEECEMEKVWEIDAEIPVLYLTPGLYKQLSILEPFGEQNASPLLFTSRLKVISFYTMGKEKEHLRIVFATKTVPMTAVFWNKSKWFLEYHKQDREYNVLYRLELNSYQDRISVQLNIVEMEGAE